VTETFAAVIIIIIIILTFVRHTMSTLKVESEVCICAAVFASMH